MADLLHPQALAQLLRVAARIPSLPYVLDFNLSCA